MRPIRKAVYASSLDEGRALFARSPSVHLATTGEDGRPILRVVHTILDSTSDGLGLLAFHGAPAGEKMEGLRAKKDDLGHRAVMSCHEVVAEIPSWFLDPRSACPATTYYVSAQAEGVLEEVHDLETKARILQTMMTKYQPEGGHVPIRADDPLYTKALKGLLVAGLRIDHLACKAKLGQNRRPEERMRVIEKLWQRGGPGDVKAVDTLVRRFPELAPPFLRPTTSPNLTLDVGIAGADDGDHEDELKAIVDLLADAYWLTDVPREKIALAILASQAVVLARDKQTGQLIAFARAVSDGKVAWIYDVIVRSSDRRSGAGTAVMKLLCDHPMVRNARVIRLGTKDAMPFYRRLGFVDINEVPRPSGPLPQHKMKTTEMIRSAATAAAVAAVAATLTLERSADAEPCDAR